MLFLICLVCLLSSFGGILLGLSLKGLLVIKYGLESGQKKMFSIGVFCGSLALVISIIAPFLFHHP